MRKRGGGRQVGEEEASSFRWKVARRPTGRLEEKSMSLGSTVPGDAVKGLLA